VRACGFPQDRLYVIKEGVEEIDGVRCVPTIESLPEKLDLLVAATGSENMPELIDRIIASRKVSSVILIPGGMGETEGTGQIQAKIRAAIQASRDLPDAGPIMLGGNSLGVLSRPGRYDTFFIPENKLEARRDHPPRRAALISQSGAFMISRMSNLALLDPTLAISLGNQIDLTVSDMLRTIGDRSDIDSIGVYVEGFNDMDGLAFVQALQDVTAAGKVVVFYKAGRTESGREATAGHTASVAGDFEVCQTAVTNAGAIVTDTFKEFEQLMELSTALHDKKARGRRIGVISNAGFETVGMADAIDGERYQLELPALSKATSDRIRKELARFKLDTLVNARNPLDLTPMANEDAYEACIRAMLEDDQIDAVVVGCVPLTPQMLTTEEELDKPGSLVERLPALLRESPKPVVAVIDSGARYEAFARKLREAGVPTFRSCDQAVRSFGRYLCHRFEQTHRKRPNPTAERKPATPVPAQASA
jgi:acyl-CoA synthetase (NDP forming)